ncbi:class I SAM-dependent methyltransferase [Chloroflexota bacterium]
MEEFWMGGIRKVDKDILERIGFRGKNVLDLGFGRGEAIKYALENGARKVIGVDFSEDACSIAREHLEKYDLSAEIYCEEALDFFQSYIARKEVEPFDIVLMLDFIEHIPRFELTKILWLMRRVLSPRVVVAINTPVYPVDNDVIAAGFDPRAKCSSDDFEETAGMHCNRYTRKSLRHYMNANGFKALSGHLFVTHLPIPRYLEDTRVASRVAFRMRYPVDWQLMRQPEQFEYALSYYQQRKQRDSLLKIIFRLVICDVTAILHGKAPKNIATTIKCHKGRLVGAILARVKR